MLVPVTSLPVLSLVHPAITLSLKSSLNSGAAETQTMRTSSGLAMSWFLSNARGLHLGASGRSLRQSSMIAIEGRQHQCFTRVGRMARALHPVVRHY